MKESWLDVLDWDILDVYLIERFSGKRSSVLYSFKDEYVMDKTGKRTGLKLYLEIIKDYDSYLTTETYDAFGRTDLDNIDNIFRENLWIEMMRELNKGKIINGQTYDEARLESIEQKINTYYKKEYQKLDVNKTNMLNKLKMLKIEQGLEQGEKNHG